jgi:hypothetical protein
MIYVTKYISDNVMETLIRTGTVAQFLSYMLNKQIKKNTTFIITAVDLNLPSLEL